MTEAYSHGGEIYGKNIRLDFSINVNPLGMPEGVKQAAVEMVPKSFRYPDDSCAELKKAIAGAKGLREAFIVCGNGAADLIYRYALAIKAKRALLLAPTFSEYEKSFALAGTEISYYPLREETGFAVDYGILTAAEQADVVVLCNPNNPVGNLIERGILLKLLQKAEEGGRRLFLDECFMELSGCEGECAVLPFVEKYRGLFVLRAFTKTYAMAGLRLGYGVTCDRELLQSMRESGAPWSVSTVAQSAGIAALGEVAYLERAVSLIKKERVYLFEELSALGYTVYPSKANFLLFRADKSLYGRLLSKGILIRQCGNYKGLDRTYYRICVGLHSDNEELLRVLKKEAIWQR